MSIRARSASDWFSKTAKKASWIGVFFVNQSLALRACIVWVVLSLISCGAICAQTQETESLAIVSINKEQKLAVYSIDEAGKFVLEHETVTTGNPGCSTVNADCSVLYVAMKKSDSIAAFAVGADAELKLIGETKIGAAASYLKVDPTGNFLLSAYYADGQVVVHRINEDGSLSQEPLQTIKTDERAHCVQLDPSGKFAFVPHTRPNAIFQFVFDLDSGELTPNETAKLIRKEGSGPRHLWFHPTNGHAYGSDEQGSSVTNYCIDEQSGKLEVVETLSTFPVEGFDGKNSTSDVEVHPSGKFVFVANRGHNTIVSYSIDEQSGNLTLLQHSETEPTTRSFNISPDGKHLVAAGQKSGKIRVFQIGDDGKLDLLSTTEAGEALWWVQFVTIKVQARSASE